MLTFLIIDASQEVAWPLLLASANNGRITFGLLLSDPLVPMQLSLEKVLSPYERCARFKSWLVLQTEHEGCYGHR